MYIHLSFNRIKLMNEKLFGTSDSTLTKSFEDQHVVQGLCPQEPMCKQIFILGVSRQTF